METKVCIHARIESMQADNQVVNVDIKQHLYGYHDGRAGVEMHYPNRAEFATGPSYPVGGLDAGQTAPHQPQNGSEASTDFSKRVSSCGLDTVSTLSK